MCSHHEVFFCTCDEIYVIFIKYANFVCQTLDNSLHRSFKANRWAIINYSTCRLMLLSLISDESFFLSRRELSRWGKKKKVEIHFRLLGVDRFRDCHFSRLFFFRYHKISALSVFCSACSKLGSVGALCEYIFRKKSRRIFIMKFKHFPVQFA